MNWQKHYLTYIHIHLALRFTAAPRLGKSTLNRDHSTLLGMKAEGRPQQDGPMALGVSSSRSTFLLGCQLVSAPLNYCCMHSGTDR